MEASAAEGKQPPEGGGESKKRKHEGEAEGNGRQRKLERKSNKYDGFVIPKINDSQTMIVHLLTSVYLCFAV